MKWTRLAAAMTFTSFVALFPLLSLAAAIAAATLSKDQQDRLQAKIAEQIPRHLRPAEHRESDRQRRHRRPHRRRPAAVHRHRLGRRHPGLPARRLGSCPTRRRTPSSTGPSDAGVLVGLGGALLVTVGISTVASALVGWIIRQLGIAEGGFGGVLLYVAAFAVAVLADFLLLLYVLTLPPASSPRAAAWWWRR